MSEFLFEACGHPWHCRLKCIQCVHVLPGTNQRCLRSTTFTLPYCWQHLKSVAHLVVNKTKMRHKITNQRYNFYGLFACDDTKHSSDIVFKRGETIGVYMAEKITKAELDRRYGNGDTVAPYVLSTGENEYFDGACTRPAVAFANDCNSRANTCCHINAEFVFAPGMKYPIVKSKKNIRNGSEIFISYGTAYWDKQSIHRRFHIIGRQPHCTSC